MKNIIGAMTLLIAAEGVNAYDEGLQTSSSANFGSVEEVYKTKDHVVRLCSEDYMKGYRLRAETENYDITINEIFYDKCTEERKLVFPGSKGKDSSRDRLTEMKTFLSKKKLDLDIDKASLAIWESFREDDKKIFKEIFLKDPSKNINTKSSQEILSLFEGARTLFKILNSIDPRYLDAIKNSNEWGDLVHSGSLLQLTKVINHTIERTPEYSIHLQSFNTEERKIVENSSEWKKEEKKLYDAIRNLDKVIGNTIFLKNIIKGVPDYRSVLTGTTQKIKRLNEKTKQTEIIDIYVPSWEDLLNGKEKPEKVARILLLSKQFIKSNDSQDKK